MDTVESLNLKILTRKHEGDFYFGTEVIEQLKYFNLPRLKKLTINSEGIKGLRVDLLAPEIEYLNLTDSDITGSTISYLKSLHSLQEVYLGQTTYRKSRLPGNLTSGSIRNLSKISSLKKINLSGNPIKGADFSLFESLKDLESLDISETDITRSNLKTLHGLKQLKELKIACLRSSTIRDEDIQELSEVLKDCKIITEK